MRRLREGLSLPVPARILVTNARLRVRAAAVLLLVLAFSAGIPCRAQNTNQTCTAQIHQPDWASPVVTSTARLSNGIRDDIFFENGASSGGSVTDYGGMKGVSFAPRHHRFGIRIGLPSYIVHHDSAVADGFDDIPVRLKYRLRSQNPCRGNYILTLFLNIAAAMSSIGAGHGHGSYGPTVAFGKGWGSFDTQSTLGATIPIGAVDSATGTYISLNNAFQYRVLREFWPEIEVNSTWWLNGKYVGKKQTFLTPGLIYGKIPIHNCVALSLGAGVQIAATHYHAYNHKVVLSARMSF